MRKRSACPATLTRPSPAGCSRLLMGVSGVLLFVIIFVFAHPIIRKKAYNFFWKAHSLYILDWDDWWPSPPSGSTWSGRLSSTRWTRWFMGCDIIETVLLPSDVLKSRFTGCPTSSTFRASGSVSPEPESKAPSQQLGSEWLKLRDDQFFHLLRDELIKHY